MFSVKLVHLGGIFLGLLLAVACEKNPPTSSDAPAATSQARITPRQALEEMPLIQLGTPGGQLVSTFIAYTAPKQVQGLSDLPEADFSRTEGLLFYYRSSKPHRFWMPRTHFNLDIFFLDEEFKILAVEREMQAHPSEEPPIPTTRSITSRHVFEMRADSPVSKGLQVGDRLLWLKSNSLLPEQIESKILQGQ